MASPIDEPIVEVMQPKLVDEENKFRKIKDDVIMKGQTMLLMTK